MQKFWIPLVLVLAWGGDAAAGSKGGLICWTDNQGHRACGDHVPAEYSKTERDVFNKAGVQVGTQARQKTDAEVAAEQRVAAQAVAEKHRLAQQTAYDNFMLQTFQSVPQMQTMRDTRLSTLDGRLTLAQKAVADNETTLKGLRDRVAAKPDVRVSKQITQYEASLVDNLKSVAQLKEERVQTEAKFNGDIERYKKLRSGDIKVGSVPETPPPAAEAASDAAPAPAAAPAAQ